MSLIYALLGYYSDVTVVADHIMNPPMTPPPNQLDPRDVLLLWRRLSFRAWPLNQTVMGAPSIDLTHASNTTLRGHIEGMKELQVMTMMSNFIIRDARGNGKLFLVESMVILEYLFILFLLSLIRFKD